MAETNGQLVKSISSPLGNNAGKLLYLWQRPMGTENNGDGWRWSWGVQLRSRKICQETQIKWEEGKTKTKAAIPTYKIYKKGEFG